MGIHLTAKNSKHAFYMGYGGFFCLRKNIAMALDKEFGKIYSDIVYCHSSEDFAENDAAAEKIIRDKNLDEDILDFLYAEDCEGKISYKTCRKIYDLIKDVDFEKKGFRYAAYQNNDYEELKEFLTECYSKRRNMVWS